MLRAAEFDDLVTPIMELYERYETSIIVDIAKRLSKKFASIIPDPDKVTELNLALEAWKVQRLSESGKVYDQILTELAELTNFSDTTLRKIFNDAGVMAVKFDDAIYTKAGLQPLPLNLSPAMVNVLHENIAKTNGILRNLAQSTALSGQNAYIEAGDLAYMQISTGTMSYQQALSEAVVNLASKGIGVINFTGRHDHIDVAVRRTVLTGIGQLTGQLQITRMDELGVDLVQTSAHIGARNKGEGPENHASWQGKVFSRSGNDPKYPNFIEVTGYGTGEGLNGWNCRHSFYPYFPGISEEAYNDTELQDYENKKITYNGEKISVYDATQIQRKIERDIRKVKRQIKALEAGSLPSDAQTQKLGNLQAKMRDFLSQTTIKLGKRNHTKLKRQTFREKIY